MTCPRTRSVPASRTRWTTCQPTPPADGRAGVSTRGPSKTPLPTRLDNNATGGCRGTAAVDPLGTIVLPGFVDTHRHTWPARSATRNP
jgi:hypothetical protein